MQLIIYCKDKSKQCINLHPSFVSESSHKYGSHLLTQDEVEKKALVTALSIVGNNYDKHLVTDVEVSLRDLKELLA